MNDDRQDAQSKIAAAAIEGRRDAVAALWREHRRWVAAVLLSHKPSFVDLDDLLQDVAMTVVRKIHTVREADHVRAWLRTVAVNAARAAARSGKNRPRLRLSQTENDFECDDHATDRAEREQTDRMLALVADLPDEYREPLLLRAVHGMRSRQIGEIMNISEATVDTRVARARRMLRERAEQMEAGEPTTRVEAGHANGVLKTAAPAKAEKGSRR